MGAFVSPKDTYRVPLTQEDCPSLDREEWVEKQFDVENNVNMMPSPNDRMAGRLPTGNMP